MHGRGTVIESLLGIQYYANDERYNGNWVYGAKAGEGIWYYADGSIYEGEWKDNKKNGYGRLCIK